MGKRKELIIQRQLAASRYDEIIKLKRAIKIKEQYISSNREEIKEYKKKYEELMGEECILCGAPIEEGRYVKIN